MFAGMVREYVKQPPAAQPPAPFQALGRLPNVPNDMPIYGKEFMKAEVA